MSILFWDKPPKVLPVEEWWDQQSQEHPSYEPNMSTEDAERWRAKYFPGVGRVEIRKQLKPMAEYGRNSVNLKIVIASAHTEPKVWCNGHWGPKWIPETMISLSANGTVSLTMGEYDEMLLAIQEAKDMFAFLPEDK